MSNILATIEALFEPDDVFEVRVLHKREGQRATHSGYFNVQTADEAEKFAKKYNKEGDQVYVTLNPVEAKATGTYETNVTRTTTDKMIVKRRWLPMDFDPQREPGTSATMEQVRQAERLAQEVCTHLSRNGWPEPIIAESGNGVHLLYAIDLPTDDKGIVRNVLKNLSDSFSTEAVKLDTTLHNPSRIIKLYGTVSRKGEQQRITRITNLPDREIVSKELLIAVAGELDDEPVQPKEEYQFNFDLDSFMERAGLIVDRRSKLPDGRTRITLKHCYFNPEHKGSEVAIFVSPNGKLGYKCFHNSCASHDWDFLRKTVDGTPVERMMNDFGVEQTEKNSDEDDLSILPNVDAINRTEIGNAERIVALARGSMLYIRELKKWIKFDPTTGWITDHTNALELATRSARLMLRQVDSEADPDTFAKVAVWYKQSMSVRGLEQAIKAAASMLSVSVTTFDDDPYVLGVRNGVVDLRTGKFRPYALTDRILKQCDTDFVEGAQCPVWDATIDQIFSSDKEVVKFMQRAFGYSLTGLTEAQKLMFCFGFGANGKSTVLNVLREISGTYAGVVQTNTFMDAGRDGSASPEIASLAGARVVIAQETDEGAVMKASLVKQLTGGDAIQARHLYSTPFTFIPRFQVWLSGNHKPVVSGSDHGVWRRMTLIEFKRRFEPHEQDKELDQKLRKEFPGILNWIIQGAVEYFKYKLGTPQTIEQATEDYKSDMDHVGRWFSECAEMGQQESTPSSEAFNSFITWAKQQGHHHLAKMTQTSFSNRMKERGIDKEKKGGKMWFKYFKLIDPWLERQ